MSPAMKPKPQHGQCRHIAGDWTSRGEQWDVQQRRCIRCGRLMEMKRSETYAPL